MGTGAQWTKDNIDENHDWGDDDINGGDEEEKDDGFIRSILICPLRNVLLGRTCSEHAPLLCQRPPEGETGVVVVVVVVGGHQRMRQGCLFFSFWFQVKRALTGAVLSIPVGSTINALMERDPMEKKDSVVYFCHF